MLGDISKVLYFAPTVPTFLSRAEITAFPASFVIQYFYTGPYHEHEGTQGSYR